MTIWSHHSKWIAKPDLAQSREKDNNGKQAAWASKKYHGHQVLPESIMADLDNAKLL
jgi:hypothetical protein